MHRFIHTVHWISADFYVNRRTSKANMCFVKNDKTPVLKPAGIRYNGLMRLRFVPEAEGIVAASPYVIHDELPLERPIGSFFEREAPIHIEIGTGKGGFLVELARQHPEINYIGVEIYESVLYKALEKMDAFPEEARPRNVLFLSHDARELTGVFSKGQVGRIYLNFSDPWPKKRHAKRRLTSPQFLALYEEFLAPGGEVVFKTDNKDLFEYSLEEIGAAPNWTITAVTRDLHRDPEMNRDNIMTEYERKFSALGTPINKLVAVFSPEEKAAGAPADESL